MNTEAKPKPPRERRPLLLSKVEALNYAAERLERMCLDIELASLLVGVLSKSEKGIPDADRELFEQIADESREPEIQSAAIKAAAKAIRDLATEERIVSARALTATVTA